MLEISVVAHQTVKDIGRDNIHIVVRTDNEVKLFLFVFGQRDADRNFRERDFCP